MPVANRKPRRVQVGTQVSFELGEIDKSTAKEMVLTHHYSGRCPGIKYTYGLFESGVLVGCVVYSVPASYTLCNGVCGPEYRQYVIELARLVITTPTHNAASFLVGQSLAALPDHIVVSYADCNDHIGHVGYVYQATNWVYTGQGNAEPVWLHPTTGEVISYTRRHIDVKAAKFGLLWTNLVKRKQVGKHRYVYFTGTKQFKRKSRTAIKYETYPYPKGDTRRHVCNAMEVAVAAGADQIEPSELEQRDSVVQPPPVRVL